MEINRNNYGAYFLDYWESNLSDRERRLLSEFLKQNPDLQNEFFDFGETSIAQINRNETIEFPNKNQLRHPDVIAVGEINKFNWEQWVIASLEHDLTDNQLIMFEEFVRRNPSITKEIALFRHTFLNRDRQVVFGEKDQLKKKVVLAWWALPVVRWSASVAAVFLVAFGLLFKTGFWPYNAEKGTGKPENIVLTDRSDENDPIQTENLSQDVISVIPVEVPEIASSAQPESAPESIPKTESPSENFKNRFSDQQYKPEISLLKTHNQVLFIENKFITQKEPTFRDEFSSIFGFMLIRDGLVFEQEQSKSAAGRLLSGALKLVTGNRMQRDKKLLTPAFDLLAEQGKEFLSMAKTFLPVYQTTERDGRKETAFALSECFSFRLSRSKADPETDKVRNMD